MSQVVSCLERIQYSIMLLNVACTRNSGTKKRPKQIVATLYLIKREISQLKFIFDYPLERRAYKTTITTEFKYFQDDPNSLAKYPILEFSEAKL
jgi:hypothetical protein